MADRHGIEINWLSGDWQEAESFITTRQVWVPKPYSRGLYLVALHEFGHIVSDLARELWDDEHPESGMACEAAAWAWAVTNADEELMEGASWEDYRYGGGGLQMALMRVAEGDAP